MPTEKHIEALHLKLLTLFNHLKDSRTGSFISLAKLPLIKKLIPTTRSFDDCYDYLRRTQGDASDVDFQGFKSYITFLLKGNFSTIASSDIANMISISFWQGIIPHCSSEIETFYIKMVEHFPNHWLSFYYLTLYYLSHGIYDPGFYYYTLCHACQINPDSLHNHATLQIHLLGGLGDCIQFIRFIPEIKEKYGCRIHMIGVSTLKNICMESQLSDSFSSDHFLDKAPILTSLNLPFLAGANIRQLPQSAYIQVNKALKSKYKQKLGTSISSINVLLHNQSQMDYKIMPEINPEDSFSPSHCLVRIKPVTNHQFTVTVNNQDTDIQIANFQETAALLSCMDSIITVDTSLAHLAGALGLKTFLLLPYYASWRWMSNRKFVPWYPRMRIIRQKKHGDWGSVFAELKRLIPAGQSVD